MPDATPTPPQLSLETASQATDLSQLAGIADGMGAPAPGAAPGAPAGLPATINPLALANASTIATALRALRDGFCQFTQLRAPRAIASDSTIEDLAKGWGTWCASRQIDLKTYMGNHADTIPLAISTAALGFAVWEATKAEIAARRPQDVAAKPAGEGGAGEGAAAA